MRQIYLNISKFFILFLLFISISTKAQSNYSVVPIPFVQYTGVTSIIFTADDRYSAAIPLPFTFNFYGNSYNQVVVSTNGHINFETSLASTGAPWQFSTTIPNAAFPVKNAILGCYHDMDNSNGQGTIMYGVYGTTPNRKFVVIFNNNSHYSSACSTTKSSFQMILNETSNIIDVQLIDKGVCPSWNSGNAVTGLINATGTVAITPPSRNTSSWAAFHEGWRFYRPGYYTNYQFVKCDNDNDGTQTFDLQVAINDLMPTMGSSITFHETLTDANAGVNAIPLLYTNSLIPFTQTIYAVGGGQIKTITLRTLDCAIDADTDGVATDLEDVNLDTNLANDDTDFDGLANYLDNDDDGDMILTSLEYVFPRSARNALVLLDTDHDGKPNYIDSDDDGDGVLTFMEDYNHDGNPANDDTNINGIPDYLEMGVALGTQHNELKNNILLYPNPTSNILNIENSTSETITDIEIYGINGSFIKQVKPSENTIETINVSDFQTGVYFVKIIVNDQVLNYKFIKK